MTIVNSVLFVCWGNICRSPAAVLILKREMKRLGIQGVTIDSAGISPDDKLVNPSWSMRWASLRRGFWWKPRPRMLTRRDLARFDLVLAMDSRVMFAIRTLAKGTPNNAKMLSEFLPDHWPVDVPDPMRRSAPVCNRALDMMETACSTIGSFLGRQVVTANQAVTSNMVLG
ncbi:MAG: hypothetical protein R3C03_23120 [Pirellulaceae bacterium]